VPLFAHLGLVAVAGSYYVQTEDLTRVAVDLGVSVGLLAAAILVVNNIRDIETDRRAGKRTLAVRLGRERTRWLFVAMIALAFLNVIVIVATGEADAWLLISLAAAPLAVPLVRTVRTRTDGPALNGALADAGRLLAVFSILLSAGLLLSG